MEHVHAWIARDRPSVADAVIERLLGRARGLLDPGTAHIGRPGRELGTRERVEAPYIIVYEVDDESGEVTILAVTHGRQDR